MICRDSSLYFLSSRPRLLPHRNNVHAYLYDKQCWGSSDLTDTVTGTPSIPVGVRYNASPAKGNVATIKPERLLETYSERIRLGGWCLTLMTSHVSIQSNKAISRSAHN